MMVMQWYALTAALALATMGYRLGDLFLAAFAAVLVIFVAAVEIER